MEWWKTSETATALGRNHYQVWIGRRCKRLLRHSVEITTKRGDERFETATKFCGAEMARKEGWMVLKKMFTSYNFYKSDKKESGDD